MSNITTNIKGIHDIMWKDTSAFDNKQNFETAIKELEKIRG